MSSIYEIINEFLGFMVDEQSKSVWVKHKENLVYQEAIRLLGEEAAEG